MITSGGVIFVLAVTVLIVAGGAVAAWAAGREARQEPGERFWSDEDGGGRG